MILSLGCALGIVTRERGGGGRPDDCLPLVVLLFTN